MDRLNQWMTLVANIGVVVGIFFLAIEVQQTRDAINAQTYQSRAEASQQLMMDIADSEFLTPLLSQLVIEQGDFQSVSTEEYTAEQLYRLRTYGHAIRIGLDNQHYQYERGFLDKDYYESTWVDAVRFYTPLWSKVGGMSLRKSFEKEVERLSEQ